LIESKNLFTFGIRLGFTLSITVPWRIFWIW